MHHSVAYRSVVVLGEARMVDDPAEKSRALHCLLDHIAPGRAEDCRAPDARELAATGVLALDLVEVSAKVRSGPPADDPQDVPLRHWAGVVPLSLTAGTPVPVDDLESRHSRAAVPQRAPPLRYEGAHASDRVVLSHQNPASMTAPAQAVPSIHPASTSLT